MRKPSLLIASAALASLAGPQVRAQEASVDQTAGFQAFARYCLDASEWKAGPDLQELAASDISPDEQRAVSSPGGQYRFFLVTGEPRVLLALQWQEQAMSTVPTRNGRRDESQRRQVLAVGGRCVVFSHEDRWDGMAEALEQLTGVEPQDSSSPDRGLDALFMFDTERMRDAGKNLRPWSFTASRANGTTMYRAIM